MLSVELEIIRAMQGSFSAATTSPSTAGEVTSPTEKPGLPGGQRREE